MIAVLACFASFVSNMRSPPHTNTHIQEKLRFAVVCSSNMNRSMEAHKFLKCVSDRRRRRSAPRGPTELA